VKTESQRGDQGNSVSRGRNIGYIECVWNTFRTYQVARTGIPGGRSAWSQPYIYHTDPLEGSAFYLPKEKVDWLVAEGYALNRDSEWKENRQSSKSSETGKNQGSK